MKWNEIGQNFEMAERISSNKEASLLYRDKSVLSIVSENFLNSNDKIPFAFSACDRENDKRGTRAWATRERGQK